MADVVIRRPLPARLDAEADAAMAVQRSALRATLPGLHNPHTPDEDREWVRGVFAQCSVWLAVDDDWIVGVLSREDEWIKQLYVAPGRSGQGIGQRLLDAFLDEVRATPIPIARLWTFQRNRGARRFYERNRFVAVEFGDGDKNEEAEPDVRYERPMRE